MTVVMPTQSPVTPRQRDVRDFIAAYVVQHGYGPTMEEIADALGVSKVTVFEHINELRRKGYVESEKHRARSYRVVRPKLRKERVVSRELLATTIDVLRSTGQTHLASQWKQLIGGAI